MPKKGMRSVYHIYPSKPTSSSSSSPLRNGTPPRPLFSFSESMIAETISNAEQKISKWNQETSCYAKVTSLFYESRKEARDYINCVNDLQRAMHFLLTENPTSEKLIRSQQLMQVSMKRLEKEFYQILSTNRDHFDPESISNRSSVTSRSSLSDYEEEYEDEIQQVENSITEVERVSVLAISDLKIIADCMISSGYGKECVKIYKLIRKSIIDEGLYRLGIEKMTCQKIQRLDWEIIQLKLENWLKSVKIAVTTLFSGERILCDQVFYSSDSIRESCFTEISKEGAAILFSFPELVIKSSKKSSSSSEKIFRILDLYNSVSEIWPQVESIFSFESTSFIRNQALYSLEALGDSVRIMLSEFETSVQKDSSKVPVSGGGIHPLTEYGMSFISQLSDYSIILLNLMEGWELSVQTRLPESYLSPPNPNESAISIRFAWLILVLVCKLDGKAELYKDVTLSYLFLTNNLHFIVSKVRSTSNLSFLLGEDWISKQETKVKQYAWNYERLGWEKVVSVLLPVGNNASPDEMKNLLKRFSLAFQQVYKSQSSWIVPDSKLRNEIKVSICSKLLPLYRSLFDKYRVTLQGEQTSLGDSSSSVIFSPDDLGNYLSDLFYGNASSTTTSTKSASTHSSRVAMLRLNFRPRRCFSF